MITLYNEKDQQIKLISTFEFTESNMGESSISATVLFDAEQDFHPDWYVLYNGEKFRLGVRKPTGRKDTSSLSTSYTLVFKSEREDLKRFTFMDFVELGTGNPQPNSYNVPLYATLTEFVDRFNVNLRYYMGDRWSMVLPDNYVESGNAVSISFDNATLWDVLLKVYELFGMRWSVKDVSGVMQIQVGFDAVEIEHIFEYGKDNGLISVERNNALERIVTRLRGRGSTKNLPPDYFHDGDPDTTTELQAMYFSNLMPKSYRDYIRGYNAGTGEGSWAYNQGVADKVAGKPLNPVDYVISNNEYLWGISYGAIEANEGIYPTLQGTTRNGIELDEVLAVEQVLQDGIVEPVNITTIPIGDGGHNTSIGACGDSAKNAVPDCRNGLSFTILTDRFDIERSINTTSLSLLLTPSYIDKDGIPVHVDFGSESTVMSTVVLDLLDQMGNVVNTITYTNQELYKWDLENIPSGSYRFRAAVTWSANIDNDVDDVVVSLTSQFYGGTVREYTQESDKYEFKETFDIEIRDVWGITRNEGESDEDYTYRVWSPLAVTNEMSVMFSDGLLAGEDYEFRIVGFSTDSDNLKAVITSAIFPTETGWRLTLQKSDAEVEASGRYLPNTMQNAVAGDHFFFVNIAMPYDPYVYDAEARVDAYLDEQLSLLDEEFPSFTISPSKIFCSTFNEVDKVCAGNKIRIRNAALIGASYVSLYIQSLTKRYSDKSLNPEWSVTISDQVVATGNPVSTLESNVKVLSQQVYSNRQAVREAIRAMSGTFLRKDGLKDKSYSPTEFTKKIELGEGISDKEFNRGDISGKGFGVYTDGDGNRVIEADILVGRIGARFNEVKINQTTYTGGKQVFSAAGMVVTDVANLYDSWRCFFDTKRGTEQNLFKVGDGAFCQRFGVSGTRQYWARVVAVGPDYIDISKTDCASYSSSPVIGDNIAQLGNNSDTSRQAALVIDVVRDGGGLVTWYDDITGFTLNEKDSVNIGRIDGKTWLQVFGSGYIGSRDESQYVKYENGKVSIKGTLEVGTALSDGRVLEDLIKNIQNQIDGSITTWFYEGVPTLDSAPANEWTTDELKNIHLGDLYYDSATGKAYRFQLDGTTYFWKEITDTDIQAALEAASKAQDTADGKRRVFVAQPTTPYDKGDLWVNATYGDLYNNDILKCKTSRTKEESFSIDDWELASRYTDDSKALEALAKFTDYDYLRTALSNETTIIGGLVLTTLVALGYKDSDDVYYTMAGINGVYNASAKGGGIAAWYGGGMVDAEDGTGAQSLFRFDGSGYLAGGNIRWDKEGAGAVAGGDLSWDKEGNITLATGIKISADGDETLGSLLIALNNKYDKSGGDIEGDVNVIGKLTMGTLVIPNAEGVIGEHTLMIGEVGTGAATPEGGGGGTADFSQIKVYDTNDVLLGNGSSSGKITIVPYPTSLPASDVYDWAKAATKPTYTASEVGAYPIGGGRITGNFIDFGREDNYNGAWARLYINASSSAEYGMHIRYYYDGTNYKGIRFESDGVYYSDNGTDHAIIHNGNIGSQSVSYATSAGDADTLDGYHAYEMVKSYVDDNDNFTRFTSRAFFQTAFISGQGDFCSLVIPTWTGNNTGAYYITELRFNNGSTNPKIRVTDPNGTSDWYTLARTIDNVESATKLQTARTIWGQSFDGTGNVSGSIDVGGGSVYWTESDNYFIGMAQDDGVPSHGKYNFYGGHRFFTKNTESMRISYLGNIIIGSTTDNGGKLQLDGNIHIKGKNQKIEFTNGYEIGRAALTLETYESNYAKIQSSLYGVDYICPLTLNPNGGNVIIGTTSDNGAKLQVNGNIKCKDEIDIYHNTVRLTFYEYEGIGRIYTYNEADGTLGDLWLGNNSGNILNIKANGNILIGTTDDNGAKLQVNGSISPTTTGTYSLGSSDYRWLSGHFGNSTNNVDISISNVSIKTSTTSGWARYFAVKHIDTTKFSIGAYGLGETCEYGYIGTSYDSTWVKFTPALTTFNGNISASGYQLPTSAPSNPVSGGYYLYVGTVGSGSDTPEGGSGIAQVTINVNGSPHKTDANGEVTLPPYPTSLPASDVYDWAKKSALAASDVPDLSGTYLPLSGGTISGQLNVTNINGYTPITSGNIGSQSVSYATSAGTAKASDVYAWAKAATKPTYTASEVGAYPIGGGRITGNFIDFGREDNYNGAWARLYINASSSAEYGMHIRYYYDGTNYKGIRFESDGVYYSDNGTDHAIIHNGNIGSQSVNYATSAGELVDTNSTWRVNATTSGASVNGVLSVSSNITAGGDITAYSTSDRRLKDNITPIEAKDALKVIKKLNPVTFDWNDTATSLSERLKGHSQGFIAQDYEKIIPNSSRLMWGEYKGIDYLQSIPYIVAVEQNHESRLEVLEREVKELKTRLAKYESIN